MTNTTGLVDEAMRRALLGVKSTRQGSPVSAVGPAARALADAGYVGRSGGLTRKGSILAERLRRQAEDAAFGGAR